MFDDNAVVLFSYTEKAFGKLKSRKAFLGTEDTFSFDGEE